MTVAGPDRAAAIRLHVTVAPPTPLPPFAARASRVASEARRGVTATREFTPGARTTSDAARATRPTSWERRGPSRLTAGTVSVEQTRSAPARPPATSGSRRPRKRSATEEISPRKRPTTAQPRKPFTAATTRPAVRCGSCRVRRRRTPRANVPIPLPGRRRTGRMTIWPVDHRPRSRPATPMERTAHLATVAVVSSSSQCGGGRPGTGLRRDSRSPDGPKKTVAARFAYNAGSATPWPARPEARWSSRPALGATATSYRGRLVVPFTEAFAARAWAGRRR
jgi:hypothetical protein